MNEFHIRQIFAQNLKRVLRDKNFTQKALAEKVHVTGEQVSRWVTAKNPPGWEAVAAICTCEGVRPDELFGEFDIEPSFRDEEIELFKRFQHFQKAFTKAS